MSESLLAADGRRRYFAVRGRAARHAHTVSGLAALSGLQGATPARMRQVQQPPVRTRCCLCSRRQPLATLLNGAKQLREAAATRARVAYDRAQPYFARAQPFALPVLGAVAVGAAAGIIVRARMRATA